MQQPTQAVECPVAFCTPESYVWESHPFAPGLDQVVLLSQRDHAAEATIYLYQQHGSAADVPEHVHETCDDISYVLAGSGKVEVEGYGVVSMYAGCFLRVPRGRKHRVYELSPDFRAINIFAPPRE